MLRPPLLPTLFPYTTLFRSINGSIDYYNIKLDNTVSGISAQRVVDCLEGETMNCPPGLSVYSPDAPFAPSPELGLGASFGSNGQRSEERRVGMWGRGSTWPCYQ